MPSNEGQASEQCSSEGTFAIPSRADNISTQPMDASATLAFLTKSLKHNATISDTSTVGEPSSNPKVLEFSMGTTSQTPSKGVGKGKSKRASKSQANMKKKVPLTTSSVGCGIDYSKWDRMAAELSDSDDNSVGVECSRQGCSHSICSTSSFGLDSNSDPNNGDGAVLNQSGGVVDQINIRNSGKSEFLHSEAIQRPRQSSIESNDSQVTSTALHTSNTNDVNGSQQFLSYSTPPNNIVSNEVTKSSSAMWPSSSDEVGCQQVTSSPGIGDQERVSRKRGKVELESVPPLPFKSTMRWKIENYSERRYQPAPLYSPSHVDQSGCKWRFIFYPNGEKSDNWVSLFLEVPDSENLPFGWSRTASFTITLPNQADPARQSYQRNDTHVFRGIGGDVSWGWPHFIECDSLVSEGFVSNDTLEIVAELSLEAVQNDIRSADLPGYMNAACSNGSVEQIQLCLNKGASPDVVFSGNAPLHALCMSGTCVPEAMDLLVDSGADVDLVNADGETPLLLAAYYGQGLLVTKLLDAGASPKRGPSRNGLCALGAAAQQGEVEAARRLIENGAPLSGLGIGCCVPLKQALQLKQWTCAEMLLGQGCSVQAVDGDEDYLVYAARHGTAGVIHALLIGGSDPNKTDKNGDNVVAILVDRDMLDWALIVSKVYGGSVTRCSKDRQKSQRIKLLLQVHLKRMQKQASTEGIEGPHAALLRGVGLDHLVDSATTRKKEDDNNSTGPDDKLQNKQQTAEEYARQLMEEEAAEEQKRMKKANKKKMKKVKKKNEKKKEQEEKRLQEKLKADQLAAEEKRKLEERKKIEEEQYRAQQEKLEQERLRLEKLHLEQQQQKLLEAKQQQQKLLEAKQQQQKLLEVKQHQERFKANESSQTPKQTSNESSDDEWVVQQKGRHGTTAKSKVSGKTGKTVPTRNGVMNKQVQSGQQQLRKVKLQAENKPKVPSTLNNSQTTTSHLGVAPKKQIGTKTPWEQPIEVLPSQLPNVTDTSLRDGVVTAVPTGTSNDAGQSPQVRTVTGYVTKVFGGAHGYCFVDTSIYCAREVVERMAIWPPTEGDHVEVTAKRDADRGNWKAARYVVLKSVQENPVSHVVAPTHSPLQLNPLGNTVETHGPCLLERTNVFPNAVGNPNSFKASTTPIQEVMRQSTPSVPSLVLERMDQVPSHNAFSPESTPNELGQVHVGDYNNVFQPIVDVVGGSIGSVILNTNGEVDESYVVNGRRQTAVEQLSMSASEDPLPPTTTTTSAGLPRLSFFQSLHMSQESPSGKPFLANEPPQQQHQILGRNSVNGNITPDAWTSTYAPQSPELDAFGVVQSIVGVDEPTFNTGIGNRSNPSNHFMQGTGSLNMGPLREPDYNLGADRQTGIGMVGTAQYNSGTTVTGQQHSSTDNGTEQRVGLGLGNGFNGVGPHGNPGGSFPPGLDHQGNMYSEQSLKTKQVLPRW